MIPIRTIGSAESRLYIKPVRLSLTRVRCSESRMGPRFTFAALTLAFGVALVLATMTTMHQMSVHSSSERTTVTTGLGLPRSGYYPALKRTAPRPFVAGRIAAGAADLPARLQCAQFAQRRALR
jgi:hypothetical protein